MAKSKSGLSPKQREKMLQSYGFERARSGKGSHEIWENADLKFLAQSNTIGALPANLRAGFSQKPWEVTVPHDPASGTWDGIIKVAKWCQKTVDEVSAQSDSTRQRVAFAGQFNRAASSSNGGTRGPQNDHSHKGPSTGSPRHSRPKI